jgi:hypothetical protein
MTRLVIVFGSNHLWAIAPTLKEAVSKAERPKQWIAYSIHPDTTVDGMGMMTYPKGHAPIELERKK